MLDDVVRALNDSTRRRVLQLLVESDRAVGELVLELQMEQTAVSKHLAILRAAGLVTSRPVGRHRYYQLRTESLDVLDKWLARLRPTAND